MSDLAYKHYDAPMYPQVLSIRWEMLTDTDDSGDAPDQRDDGFWPSTDPEAAGFIGATPAKDYATQYREATERMEAWRRGEWAYVGVIARAHISLPVGGGSFRLFIIDSAGLWGIESDAGDYLKEVFGEEQKALISDLKSLGERLAKGEGLTT